LELRKRKPQAPAKPELPDERVTRGFKVRTRGPTLSLDERKSKQDIAHQILSEAMKSK